MPQDEYFLEGPKNQIRTFCMCARDCLKFWRKHCCGSGFVFICKDPYPSIIKQKKVRKPLISTVL
jgi:hypothetical protein